MSSYSKLTKHPETKRNENAEWLDNYFGQHNYGVHFPSDGKVFRASDFEWTENPETMCMIPAGTPVVIEQRLEGKNILTEYRADGHKDVNVEVNSLDVDLSDPKNAEAKKVIEEQVLPKIADKEIVCTVIHKPTNDSFSFVSKRKNVHANVKVAICKYAEVENILQVDADQFCVVEHDTKAGEIKVTEIV